MARYKFHIKTQEISDVEINQTKDFKRLRHSYDNAVKPMFKIRLFDKRNQRFWISIMLIFVVIFLISEEYNKPKAEKIQYHNIELSIRPIQK